MRVSQEVRRMKEALADRARVPVAGGWANILVLNTTRFHDVMTYICAPAFIERYNRS